MQAAVAMGVAANAAATARSTPPRPGLVGATAAIAASETAMAATEGAAVASRSPPASDPVPVPQTAAGHPRSHPMKTNVQDGPAQGSHGAGGITGEF